MPRYHFHINDGELRHDHEGTELADLATAKCQAIKMTGQSICDSAEVFWDRAEWKMTVMDGIGLILFELHIIGSDAPAGSRHDRS